MAEIEKIVELFPREDPRQYVPKISVRVYYTDGSCETMQVKYGTEKYDEFMRIAYPDIDFDSDVYSEQIFNSQKKNTRNETITNIVFTLLLVGVFIYALFETFFPTLPQ